ncbi:MULTISPECIES: right-handed parallel beta-helix repeat-containing protein [unclassified Saccharicrinis]|uniref:right-handed parallel beta-helix repeat-containing protein n=1 Tax=unclassified Saccharicrinis TaxID=2646859 RepID=UPI003D3484F6
MKNVTLLLIILQGFLLFSCSESNIYVSKNGNDQNNGSESNPVATLQKAQELARQDAGKKTINIYIEDGIYYLPNTLVFGADDSGVEGREITYQSINEGKAIISGGLLLDLKWEEYKDGIYQAETPAGLNIDQVFINGKNQRMARYPNYDASKKTAAYQGFAADAFSMEKVAGWGDPTGGYIHAMHRSRWGGYHYRITGKDEHGEVTYEGGWQNNRQMGMHDEFRMVENIFEELDAPGEWYHNAKTNRLYYYPEKEVDVKDAKVEVVRLRHLVEFNGSEKSPVSHIKLKGFVFKHAARTFMDTKEPMLRSDWAIYRGGAIKLTGTEYVSILDSEFDQLGGNAIFFNNYNRYGLVKGCHIHDTGASGVCFVGDPNAVRDPLFEYHEKNDLAKIDLTVGPKTNNYPANSSVEDCLIHGIGRTERQPAGVQIEMAQFITVRDVSVYDCARAGINIGDGAWGGHLIERCDVFNTVLETHDHGSFNSWGRDRFWRSDRSVSQEFIDKNPELPFLDAMETTTIRDSRWKCEHGWDIDLDDGSSNYEIYNNLLLNGGLKFREGFNRKAWNNVILNNGFHPHVWYKNSGDEFYCNILTGEHRAIGVKKSGSGKRVDNNLFYGNVTAAKYAYSDFNWDANSITGDPLFVDPENGDFSVKEGSPAFEIGFKNFPMDQFGVKKASLRAIAETPVIPEIKYDGGALSFGQRTKRDFLPIDWFGAKLKALQGEEFSAYGVAESDGGLAVQEVQKGSILDKAGIKEGDLILAINDQPTRNRKMFLRVAPNKIESAVKITIVRDQANKSITVQP